MVLYSNIKYRPQNEAEVKIDLLKQFDPFRILPKVSLLLSTFRSGKVLA